MATLEYTQIDACDIHAGTNRGSAALPKRRVVGLTALPGTSIAGEIPLDALSVTGAAKAYGVTLNEIAVGKTGDVVVEGVVPIESDGSGTIAIGDLLTVDAATGRVKTAAPAAGANAHIVGQAHSAAAATAGAVLQMRIARSVMQGA